MVAFRVLTGLALQNMGDRIMLVDACTTGFVVLRCSALRCASGSMAAALLPAATFHDAPSCRLRTQRCRRAHSARGWRLGSQPLSTVCDISADACMLARRLLGWLATFASSCNRCSGAVRVFSLPLPILRTTGRYGRPLAVAALPLLRRTPPLFLELVGCSNVISSCSRLLHVLVRLLNGVVTIAGFTTAYGRRPSPSLPHSTGRSVMCLLVPHCYHPSAPAFAAVVTHCCCNLWEKNAGRCSPTILYLRCAHPHCGTLRWAWTGLPSLR